MIPTNISKPQDIVIIFALFALVVVTVGFGISSVENNQNVTVDTSFYENVHNRVNSTNGLKGTADSVSSGLIGQEGSTEETSESGILVKGFNSLLAVGKAYKITDTSINEATGLLGIDPIYWIIFSSVLLISFAVVMYSWIRGR